MYNNYNTTHAGLSSTTVSEAFYWGELESEMRISNMLDFVFKLDNDREKCMKLIEKKRRNQLYPHLVCTDECKKRGTAINIQQRIITLTLP